MRLCCLKSVAGACLEGSACVEATFHAGEDGSRKGSAPCEKSVPHEDFRKYGDPPGHTTPNGNERGEHFSPAWAAGEPGARLGGCGQAVRWLKAVCI